MSVYNTLITCAECPYCREFNEVHADFRFGFRDQTDYRIGDMLTWEGKGVRTPRNRPDGGNFSGEGYTECPGCQQSFWLIIDVEDEILVRSQTDWDREEYKTPSE